mmetsp:Transcript_94464/g.197328  ORF Transcript_94464/g.197328 Transcript_94464/m.197328 type:complete len:110 (-) Transcript_94464:512-841(-)
MPNTGIDTPQTEKKHQIGRQEEEKIESDSHRRNSNHGPGTTGLYKQFRGTWETQDLSPSQSLLLCSVWVFHQCASQTFSAVVSSPWLPMTPKGRNSPFQVTLSSMAKLA